MAYVLLGRVVTFDPAQPEIRRGAVYVADGLIQAVADRRAAPPAGFDEAPRIRTGGVIYPGLIDLHNHLAYNYRGLWFASKTEPYETRYQWPRDRNYRPEISLPTAALGAAVAKALLKFVEVKAVVAGTTAIQGSPKFNKPYEGWLVRNIEHETFGTGEDVVYQSVMNLRRDGLEDKAAKMAGGAAFIYHLAEGTAAKLRDEFTAVEEAGCVQSRFIGIHSTALRDPDFAALGAAGAAIVWSPFSNLWLYRDTTDVVAARAAGVRICLGADWGPSGSKNLLGELKVADLWNRTRLGGAFSDRELCEMATAAAGDALGEAWGERIGRIKPGLQADLVATMNRRPDPYRNLIDTTERHVRLVTVGGVPVFGNASLMRAAGARSPEPITVAGVRRSISLIDPDRPDADTSWRMVIATLEHFRSDPEGAFQAMQDALPPGEELLQFEPDMPEGDAPIDIGAPADLAPVMIPPLDTLAHDAAFFRNLDEKRAPILGGLLDGLRDYYR